MPNHLRHVAVMLAALAGGAPFLAGCGVVEMVLADCDWSNDDKARLESVPLGEFTTGEDGVPVARCSVSTPDELRAVLEGTPLPDGWYDRTTVGAWTAAERRDDVPVGWFLCFTSTEPRWDDIEVRLWSDGLVEAVIRRGHRPCQ